MFGIFEYLSTATRAGCDSKNRLTPENFDMWSQRKADDGSVHCCKSRAGLCGSFLSALLRARPTVLSRS
eukprot:s185_g28.t1